MQHLPCEKEIVLLYGDTGNATLTRAALWDAVRLAAEHRAVWVLDGANSFDAYFAARVARSLECAPEALLARIRLSRAFTCYQMSELIARQTPAPVDAPTVVFCLGLLETFYDEDIPVADAVRLLKRSLAQLANLARRGVTIVITARPPRRERSARVVLWNLVRASANQAHCIAAPSVDQARLPMQPRLLAA
ncbi:MAG: hypothetical protein KGJ80_14205 [Chloroflexota bacterium]|nr:hypothetical protein [Chloroflexota bacterium]